ncbi:hypothetical protein HL658_33670 [Azospirillum sp. RWY-5-1]|uniref:Sulfotransferase n=1 Tax=Azospirillum oleiclasticum TaxID=2735135 RepID=A0ABX2TKK9_9PROT|nr:sulfotransferase [Azospirillum oleiclasticum]NYZ17518.1 hypothetical protein [Azospirillum oleiclasticum]NYZ24896.1 hypothetical protein [Azospirillum oleiclasticum]
MTEENSPIPSAGEVIGPDFIAIGPPRTGTSWLFQVLNSQPSCMFFPVKEINYFCIHIEKTKSRLAERLLLLDARNSEHNYHKSIYEKILRSNGSIADYMQIFRRPKGKIVGDISPYYFDAVSKKDMEKIRFIINDKNIPIIITLRDPVMHAMSWLKHLNKMRVIPVEEFSKDWSDIIWDEFLAWSARMTYAHHFKRWKEAAGNNLRVFHFEEILQAPAGYLKSIGKEIGIDITLSDADISNLSIKVNGSPELALRPRLVSAIAAALTPEINAFARMVPAEITEKWYETARLAQATPEALIE